MKAELRIGNFVDYEKTTHKITELHRDRVFHSWEDSDNYFSSYDRIEPIPLTEEWLIRFGFIYDENLFGLKMPLPDGHVRFTSPRWVTRNLVADVIETPFLRFDATHTDVYFVHSLQNLFYALTGQELTSAPPQR